MALPPPARVRTILAALEGQHPGADTQLRWTTPFELLVATILSAQTTDQGVNQVTPSLFARWPDARSLARADPVEVEPVIQSTGFFRQKARTIVKAASELTDRFGGEVPGRMEALVGLAGVGRKTANVVLGHALGVPGFAVDRHVLRVANRLGIADSSDPDEVERQVTSRLPAARWTVASDTLILHGRRVCKPKPACGQCAARALCPSAGSPPDRAAKAGGSRARRR